MTAKVLLARYSTLPAPERRKVKTFFARLVAKEENARDLAAAQRALAENGPDSDWENLRRELPWNRKPSRAVTA
jgi:hypothetical protein